jgi:hypothetical protein
MGMSSVTSPPCLPNFTYFILLDRAFRKRELLCIAGAEYHIRVGPVLRIEERIAPDRDRRIGLGDLAELHPDVALARIRAHGFRAWHSSSCPHGSTIHFRDAAYIT